jgi:acyl carrier protein
MSADSAASETYLSWSEFTERVSEVAAIDPHDIRRESSIVDDLRLDSLSLTELVVLCLVDLDFTALGNALPDREWRRATVGGLYDEYVRHATGRAVSHDAARDDEDRR